jgi:transcriptional regulator with XRE-family HTH domain
MLASETSIHSPMRGDGKRLAAKRSDLGWSREKLARIVDLSAKSVENHEKARHPISHEWVVKYAKALGCRPSELAAPEEAEKAPERPSERSSYPAPVVELLRVRRHLEIEPEELAELSRYVLDGNPDDVESLEIELLMRRASRKLTSDSALNDFAAAVNRRRVAEGALPWKPEAAAPKLLPRGQKSRS